MPYLTRRTLLGACALGAVAAGIPAAAARASPMPMPMPMPNSQVPAPGILTRLPGEGTQKALTVDDGCSTGDVAALGRFCADTGMRLTFFVNGINKSWTDGLIRTSPGSARPRWPTKSVETPTFCDRPTVWTAHRTSGHPTVGTTPPPTPSPPLADIIAGRGLTVTLNDVFS